MIYNTNSNTLRSTILSTILVFLIISPVFSQNKQTASVKGKIIESTKKELIPYAQVTIYTDADNKMGIEGEAEGLFELEIPEGTHTIEVDYIGYDSYKDELEVKAGELNEIEIVLYPTDTSPPWKSSEAYPELEGYWKPVKYMNGNETIDQTTLTDQSGFYFNFPEEGLPGKFAWNGGCNTCRSIYFRHTGNFNIELQKDGKARCTLVGCPRNEELMAFLVKMTGRETKTHISEDGDQLELTLGDERYILRKVHDASYPKFKTELFGKWKPIKADLKGNCKKRFEEDAQVVFDWRKDIRAKMGSIQYVDGNECDSEGMNLTYRYLDEDFISFQYYSQRRKPEICETKYIIGEIFQYFSNYGCQITKDDEMNRITLEYKDTQLVLERMIE